MKSVSNFHGCFSGQIPCCLHWLIAIYHSADLVVKWFHNATLRTRTIYELKFVYYLLLPMYSCWKTVVNWQPSHPAMLYTNLNIDIGKKWDQHVSTQGDLHTAVLATSQPPFMGHWWWWWGSKIMRNNFVTVTLLYNIWNALW